MPPRAEIVVGPRPWLVIFEDPDQSPCTFASEQEARTFYAQAEMAWNCHLYAPATELASLEARCKELSDSLKEIATTRGNTMSAHWLKAMPQPLSNASPLQLSDRIAGAWREMYTPHQEAKDRAAIASRKAQAGGEGE